MPFLSRDGVRLGFEEAGNGSPPLLFVHGWTCNRTFFAPQFDHFQRARRVVAVDLRGHGDSDKPEQDYTMQGFADDLAWLCSQLDLEKPVVIGHSMGGVIALALAADSPHLPAAIVTLDSPILLPNGLLQNLALFAAGLRGPEYRELQRQFIADMMFLPTDDATRKQEIIDQMSATPQHVMQSAFENMFTYDQGSAAAACEVPWLALFADQVLSDLARLRELCPRLVTGQTVGAGHFHHLEVPEQIDSMIERFLSVSVPR